MKKSFKFIIVAFCFCLFSCTTSKSIANRDRLKEYAFCKCFEYASKDSAFFKNDLSAAVYREIANYSPEVYEAIDSIAKKAASEILPSPIADHNGRKSIVMGCFIFYNSQKLDSLVKTMDKKIFKN